MEDKHRDRRSTALIKQTVSKSLSDFILVLQSDIDERVNWIRQVQNIDSLRIHEISNPKFTNRYGKRPALMNDDRIDRKMEENDIRSERKLLSSDLKELIKAIRTAAQVRIEFAITDLEKRYENDLRTNPLYVGISEETKLQLASDYDKLISQTKRNIQKETDEEIRKIILSARQERLLFEKTQETEDEEVNKHRKRKDKKSSKNVIASKSRSEINETIQRIKRESIAEYNAIAEEYEGKRQEMIKEFDKQLMSIGENDLTDAEIASMKEARLIEIDNEIQSEKKYRQDCVTVKRRLEIAREQENIEYDPATSEKVFKIMKMYCDKMNKYEQRPRNNICYGWERALVDIDRSFRCCKDDVEMFVGLMVDYWGYINDESRRMEYDRLMRLYAITLSKNFIPVTEEDLQIENLRKERDQLFSELRALDAEVLRIISEKQAKIRQMKKDQKAARKCVSQGRKFITENTDLRPGCNTIIERNDERISSDKYFMSDTTIKYIQEYKNEEDKVASELINEVRHSLRKTRSGVSNDSEMKPSRPKHIPNNISARICSTADIEIHYIGTLKDDTLDESHSCNMTDIMSGDKSDGKKKRRKQFKTK